MGLSKPELIDILEALKVKGKKGIPKKEVLIEMNMANLKEHINKHDPEILIENVKKEIEKNTGKAVTDIKIVPLRDFMLHSPPLVVMKQLKKGVEATVPSIYESALKTEKVI